MGLDDAGYEVGTFAVCYDSTPVGALEGTAEQENAKI